VVLGKQSIPLRWVTLPVTFGDASNYRTETLAFEVVITVITVEAKAQQALHFEQDSIELAIAAVAVTELRELSLQVPSTSPSPTMPPLINALKAVEDAKAMQIDTEDPARTVQIGDGLNPK
jgi:hypothetical protein